MSGSFLHAGREHSQSQSNPMLSSKPCIDRSSLKRRKRESPITSFRKTSAGCNDTFTDELERVFLRVWHGSERRENLDIHHWTILFFLIMLLRTFRLHHPTTQLKKTIPFK